MQNNKTTNIVNSATTEAKKCFGFVVFVDLFKYLENKEKIFLFF